jgi:hypothetical protein
MYEAKNISGKYFRVSPARVKRKDALNKLIGKMNKNGFFAVDSY